MNIEMLKNSIIVAGNDFIINISNLIQKYAKDFWNSILILIAWAFASFLVYKFVIYIFKKFNIIDIIDRFTMVSIYKKDEQVNNDQIRKFSDNIKIDLITAKSAAYYIFLLSFRSAIVNLWIDEVENFLNSVVEYLPNLFIAVVILFFGMRFANFVYDLIYYPLDMSNQENAEIIAMWWKIIILFFTLMVVLAKVWIPTEITNIILTGFVSMLAISWGLAFWLWGRDLAKEILESFKKDKNKN